MALHHQPDLIYSDLPATDLDAIYAELTGGFTQYCIIDNSKSPFRKQVMVHMKTMDGRTLNLPPDWYAAFEKGKVNLSSLQAKVNEFSFAWRKRTCDPWDELGVCAPAGKYYDTFGVEWDEHDNARPILDVAP